LYYQVVAVDKRFNHSDYSVLLVLEKPDVIPPIAPIFSNYKIDSGVVHVEWIESPEPECTHILYKRNLTDNTIWEIIYMGDSLKQFADAAVEPGKTYRYSIYAKDKSGLISEPSTSLTLKVMNVKAYEVIKEVNSFIDRKNNYLEIFWRTQSDEIAEYTIYKQTGEGSPSTWKVLPVTIKRVFDQNVKPNNTYTYHIRPTLADGRYAKVKSIEVKF